MMNKADFQIFLNKVPVLRSKRYILFTILYILSLITILVLFFLLDTIYWFMPILTQLILAIIVTVIAYLHFKYVNRYREKYGELAYQYYFFHFMLPYLVTWYALFFHPLFINGSPLLPFEVAVFIAILFLLVFILVSIHIERSGFKTIIHGMDIYTVFPEEATIVRGEIYGYIRHPLYLSLTCGCFAMAFFANNLIAITASVLQLLPSIIVGKLEDNELIKRLGEDHVKYIEKTSLIFPLKKPIKFLKLLFLFKAW